MCEPILDSYGFKLETEQFKGEIVKEYLADKQGFTKHPLRHYSQLETRFEPDELITLCSRVKIPLSRTKALVIGGFTGQFAIALRQLGMQVVFTDPLEEWVLNARSIGLEAHRLAMEEIPAQFLERTDLVAAFELFFSFTPGKTNQALLRLLTTKLGILFVESKRTMAEMEREEGHRLLRLKGEFLPFKKIYGVERSSASRRDGELTFHRFVADDKTRQTIGNDCRFLKALHDSFQDQSRIGVSQVQLIAERLGIDHSLARDSLRRVLSLFQVGLDDFSRRYLYHGVDILAVFSKIFHVDTTYAPVI